MAEIFFLDDSRYRIENGRYVVFDDAGEFTAQGDAIDDVMTKAKAKGVRVPALVDLELAQDRVYVF